MHSGLQSLDFFWEGEREKLDSMTSLSSRSKPCKLTYHAFYFLVLDLKVSCYLW